MTWPNVGSLIAPIIISAPPPIIRCTSRPSILSPSDRSRARTPRCRTSDSGLQVQAHRLVLGLVEQRRADGLERDRVSQAGGHLHGIDRPTWPASIAAPRCRPRRRSALASIGVSHPPPRSSARSTTRRASAGCDVAQRRNCSRRLAAPFAVRGDARQRDRRRFREGEARNCCQRFRRGLAAHEHAGNRLAADPRAGRARDRRATSSASVTSGGMKITSTLSTLGSASNSSSDAS